MNRINSLLFCLSAIIIIDSIGYSIAAGNVYGVILKGVVACGLLYMVVSPAIKNK